MLSAVILIIMAGAAVVRYCSDGKDSDVPEVTVIYSEPADADKAHPADNDAEGKPGSAKQRKQHKNKKKSKRSKSDRKEAGKERKRDLLSEPVTVR